MNRPSMKWNFGFGQNSGFKNQGANIFFSREQGEWKITREQEGKNAGSMRKNKKGAGSVRRFFPGAEKTMVKTGKKHPGKNRFWTGLFHLGGKNTFAYRIVVVTRPKKHQYLLFQGC